MIQLHFQWSKRARRLRNDALESGFLIGYSEGKRKSGSRKTALVAAFRGFSE
jgi:hypothetical protein